MSYGLKVFDQNQTEILSSNSMATSVYDIFITPYNQNGSKSYPELVGHTIQVQTTSTFDPAIVSILLPYQFTIDYTQGFPRVNWTLDSSMLPGGARYPQHTVYVMLLTVPPGANYGININNALGETVLSYNSRVYQYIGLAAPSNNTGNSTYTSGYMNATISSPTGRPIFFVENLQNQRAFIRNVYSSGSNYTARIYKNTTHIPRVLCFAPFSPPAVTSGIGFNVYNETGLLFTSTIKTLAADCYAIKKTPSIATSGSTATFTIPGTVTLDIVGNSLPLNSACMCSSDIHTIRQVSSYRKGAFVAVVKSSQTVQTCWLIYDWNTGYVQSSNLNMDPRIYFIDINKYIN